MIGPAGFMAAPRPCPEPGVVRDISEMLPKIAVAFKPTPEEFARLHEICVRRGMHIGVGRPRNGETSALVFLREHLGISKSTITRLARASGVR